MFSVRIDKSLNGYTFHVHEHDGSLEMVALDSTPAIIATVHASDAGAACARAWHLAVHMHDSPLLNLEEAQERLLAGILKTDP
jgi:hypothetical protein